MAVEFRHGRDTTIASRTTQWRKDRSKALIAGLALVLATASVPAFGHEAGQHKTPAAGTGAGSAAYAFPLPQPGSYQLPPIKRAAGGHVLDEHGRDRDLGKLLRGRISILAFIYTRCGDICPVASMQLSFVQDLASRDPVVAARVQLVSMSFDPEHDTPAVMAEHAKAWRSQLPHAPGWEFLTAPDRAALAPVLAAYDQTVGRKRNPDSPTGPFTHIFRAFLIDRAGRIRNIYSLDFLDPQLVLNDVRTLAMEDDTAKLQNEAAK
jgi:protein SCO1/2